MIIYPPLIGDVIPAFTMEKVEIPFQQNPAVNFRDEVKSMSLVIKDYNTSKQVKNSPVSTGKNNINYNEELKTGVATFYVPEETFKEKQYYKFQIAYSDEDGEDLYYSVASIGRCIPGVRDFSIRDFSLENINLAQSEYVGVYGRPTASEPLYSYSFKLSNTNGQVIDSTGEVIWNVANDVADEVGTLYSYPRFKPLYDLEDEELYVLTFSITTINGYEQSIKYFVIKTESLNQVFNGGLEVTQSGFERDEGYVLLRLNGGTAEDGAPAHNKTVNGKFVLERTADGRYWEEITRFETPGGIDPDYIYWKDTTVEHGVTYQYGLRQYYDNVYSKRLVSNKIVPTFDHIFLSDGKRQLKIQFDPKISSFKDTILESKMDTIGNQYPFFFRNGKVKYKDIPIGGLISYWIDENNSFMTNEELGLLDADDVRTETFATNLTHNPLVRTTTLVDYNIAAERKFKLAVMDWLGNGEPKLFRSPTEGNYVIRLMNVSLTPNDTLGRMLHSFTSSGYEIADSSFNSLKKLKLVDLSLPKPKGLSETINLNLPDKEQALKYTNVYNLTWDTTMPGTIHFIKLDGQIFYNTFGHFETPKGQLFNNLEIALSTEDTAAQHSFVFNILKEYSYNEAEDSFKTAANKAVIKWIWVSENTINNYNISNLHYLVAMRGSDAGTSSFTIDGSTIEFVDGDNQTRYYKNYGPVGEIKINNVKILALIQGTINESGEQI